MLIATKIYRPDTLSVAGWSMDENQEVLKKWWRFAGDCSEIIGQTLAEKLPNRRLLRSGNYTITAKKRRGHILLEAHYNFG